MPAPEDKGLPSGSFAREDRTVDQHDFTASPGSSLSNSAGVELMARYTWGQFRFYAGYIYARLMNPSDDYPNGFPTIAEGIFVPPGP